LSSDAFGASDASGGLFGAGRETEPFGARTAAPRETDASDAFGGPSGAVGETKSFGGMLVAGGETWLFVADGEGFL
jgi:hypothetical protein